MWRSRRGTRTRRRRCSAKTSACPGWRRRGRAGRSRASASARRRWPCSRRATPSSTAAAPGWTISRWPPRTRRRRRPPAFPDSPARAGPGLDGARQAAIDPAATGGLATRFVEPLGLSGAPGGRIERIDHLGVASADNLAAEAVFAGRLGLPVESRQTDMEVRQAIESFTSDKYGVVYRARPPEPVGGLRASFLTVGDCELEFLQNFDPRHGVEMRHGAAGDTKQDQGAIAGYVAKNGPGLHHIALKTPDIDGVLAHLGARGRRTIDRVGRPGGRRSLIGFVHPSSFGGVLLHLVQREDLPGA